MGRRAVNQNQAKRDERNFLEWMKRHGVQVDPIDEAQGESTPDFIVNLKSSCPWIIELRSLFGDHDRSAAGALESKIVSRLKSGLRAGTILVRVSSGLIADKHRKDLDRAAKHISNMILTEVGTRGTENAQQGVSMGDMAVYEYLPPHNDQGQPSVWLSGGEAYLARSEQRIVEAVCKKRKQFKNSRFSALPFFVALNTYSADMDMEDMNMALFLGTNAVFRPTENTSICGIIAPLGLLGMHHAKPERAVFLNPYYAGEVPMESLRQLELGFVRFWSEGGQPRVVKDF